MALPKTSRRQFLKAASAAALLPMPAIAQGAGPKVVVIGGGFAGASAARSIKAANRAITVTLVESNPTFTACPFSNGVIGRPARPARAAVRLREYLRRAASRVAFQTATGVDAQARNVTLGNGTTLSYDRLVMAPGVDLRFDGLPGYTERSGRHHAACLEGRRADAAAAQPARGDGGRRHRHHRGAGEPVPLPAGAL